MQFADDQAASRVEYEDGFVLTKCDQCRQAWRERNARGIAGSPPCETCRVTLLPENEEAAEIFMTVRGQVITRGMDGMIVDINHLAVDAAMERNGVRDRRRVFEKVVRTFHHFLKERADHAG